MVRISVLFSIFLSILAPVVSPTPHEGHHGFPGQEFNSSVIHSNQSHPHVDTLNASHEHSHPGHGLPIQVLNESQILLGHAPDPLSYIGYDLFGDRQGFKGGFGDDAFDIVVYSGKSHGWLILWHILSTTTAFFLALPASIALRSAKHPLQPVVHSIFLVFVFLGWSCAAAYRKVTPDLYVNSFHSTFGQFVLLATLAVSAAEYIPKVVRFFRRFFAHVQSISERGGIIGTHDIIEAVHAGWNEHQHDATASEAAHLMDAEPQEVLFEAAEWSNEPSSLAEPSGSGSSSPRYAHDSFPHPHRHVRRGYRHHLHSRQLSVYSDASEATTLRNYSPTFHHGKASLDSLREEEEEETDEVCLGPDTDDSHARQSLSGIACVVRAMRHVWERLLVVLAYVAFVSGAVVYTGICRGNYLNGCLAHLIKGSIFFIYGMLTFSRYIGAFADLGWAWNRVPHRKGKRTRDPPSAELIESFVIFLYGATNTWMERFGAEPGSPYTAKQIQHISIAVMYFFGGAIGIALEINKRSRAPALSASNDLQAYRESYNPFAAVCIGVTGIAMATHHQTYVFQVQIHMLWGTLLGLYSVLRCLTYFSLWLSPPRSTDPSRPPTEALASFLLTGGGLAFISSTEQIGFWAMRSGRDDMMMFANVIVALVFLCFTWLFAILAFWSWAARRMAPSPSPSPSRRSFGSIPHRRHRSVDNQVQYELDTFGNRKGKYPVGL